MITLLIDDTARFPYGIAAATVPQKSQLQQAQDTRGESTLEEMSPAPWRLVDGAPTVVVDRDNKYVATTSTEVDAKAIAAAPWLLVATKTAHAALLSLEKFLREDDVSIPSDVLLQCENACAKCQAAESKAEGR